MQEHDILERLLKLKMSCSDVAKHKFANHCAVESLLPFQKALGYQQLFDNSV